VFNEAAHIYDHCLLCANAPCIGSRPLRGRGGAAVAGANSCWLWHPRLAVGSQQRSEGPFPVRRPDGLCADATDGTGPFDRTLGVGRRGEFAGTEKRDFSVAASGAPPGQHSGR
jgi:hypothetical protein